MHNTLSDLNNYLFEQLERINDDSLTPEQLEVELKKTDSIVKVSDQIIRNGELAFHTMQHLDSHGYNSDNRKIPPMLIDGGEW